MGENMSDLQVVSSFERFVFVVTRLLVALTALGAVIGIALCALFLIGKFDKPTSVSYEEVKQSLSNQPSSETPSIEKKSGEAAPVYNLPASLKPYLSENNRRTFDGWMRSIDSEDKRAEFLSELSAVVKAAETDGKDITEVINKYKELKFQKLSLSPFDKYQTLAAKAGVTAMLFGLVFLLVILALALVLMAIERHSRRITERLNTLQEGAGKIEVNTRAAALALRPKPPQPGPRAA
jgi:hypothetical protein